MAENLQKQFEASTELVKSSGGVFEVEMDGELIFSKKQLNRFPDDGEIEAAVKSRQ